MKHFIALTVYLLVLVLISCNGQDPHQGGVNAGASDPLKLGFIDPVALEVGASYALVVPTVIFTLGILAVPTTLVIIFLFVLPLIVPPEGEGRKKRSVVVNVQDQFSNLGSHLWDATRHLPEIVGSSCLEDVSCQVTSAIQRKFNGNEWIQRSLANENNVKHPVIRRIMRSLRWIGNEPKQCVHPCKPVDAFIRYFGIV